MIVGLGVDTVEVSRICAVWHKHGDRFAKRLLGLAELDAFMRLPEPQKPHFLARRFAAKEAAFKALGTGLRGDMRWRDVNVSHDSLSRPSVTFRGGAAARLSQLGGRDPGLISISDERNLATAVVVLQTGDE